MQSFDKFVSKYQPLKFHWLGMNRTERIPKESRLDFLHVSKIRIKSMLGMPITYMDVKHSMTPDGKKAADLAFITYFVRKRDTQAQNAPRGSKLHFRWLYLCYFPEIRHINSRIGTKEADDYMLRWGYLLDVNPSFVELIHGTNGESAMYAVENIYQ